jgi:hypothetical protein
MILSSCMVFPFSWPGLEPQFSWDHRKILPMGKWVWNSLSIFQAPFPSWRRVHTEKQFPLNYNEPQEGLGRHQGGSQNSWGMLLGSVIWVLHSSFRGSLLFIRSQGVGSGSLASEKCLGSGESQAVLKRTLCLLQEMPSNICHFGVIATGFLRLSNWTCLLVCSSLLSFFFSFFFSEL